MLRAFLCLAAALLAIDALKFTRLREPVRRLSRGTASTRLGLTSSRVDSFLIAVGDYAAEIEKATVGEEVYAPIFRAGIFLFTSGLVSAAVAAFIISKADSWEDLGQEFEEGKKDKLIFSEYEKLNSNTNNGDAITLAMETKNNDRNIEDMRSKSGIDSALKNLDV